MPLGFERIELVRELLGGFDLVISVDTDAMIMNHTLPAESFWSPGIVISEDLFGINDGVFAASNSALSQQFLAVLMMMRKSGSSQDVFTHLRTRNCTGR